jgi:hypothetical protein
MSAKAGAARPLGINTHIASGVLSYKAIMAAREAGAGPEEIAVLLVKLKWQRMRTVYRLMPLKYKKDENGKLEKQEFRVSMCHRVQVKPFIEVLYSAHRARASYGGGLMKCGNVHSCPVCKARVTEQDRHELEHIDFASLKLRVMLVTLTLSHVQKDTYDDVRRKLEFANRRMRSGRTWQEFKKEFGYIGSITSTEDNYNLLNGWHVHKHILFVLRDDGSKLDAEHAADVIRGMYLPALQAAGGWATAEHGVNVVVGDNASVVAQYIAKWGHEPKDKRWTAQAEVTKSPAKAGRTGESLTVDQLLDVYAEGGKLAKLAGAKFIEHARGTRRKNRLVYSPGLRSKLLLGKQIPDTERAKAYDDDKRLLALLRREHWKIIDAAGLQGWVIIDAARSGDFTIFQNALADFGIHIDRPNKHKEYMGK